MEYFWTYQSDLPVDVGIPNFSAIHIISLSLSLVLILVAVLVYKRQQPVIQVRTQKTLVVLIACLDVSRWIWAACIGHYSVVDMLPLHLCSLTVWMEMAAVWTGRPILKGVWLCAWHAWRFVFHHDTRLERLSAPELSIFAGDHWPYPAGSGAGPLDLGRRFPSRLSTLAKTVCPAGHLHDTDCVHKLADWQ